MPCSRRGRQLTTDGTSGWPADCPTPRWQLIGDAWTWRTEVPVTTDPREQRAIDALLIRPPHQVGVEAVTRLIDAQGQVRPIILKQQAASISCMLLLVADTRLNRRAIDDGAATLRPAFRMGAKALLAELRAGRQPASNGLVLL